MTDLIISGGSEWLPNRQFVVTGDSAYGGTRVLQKLPKNIDLISLVIPRALCTSKACIELSRWQADRSEA